MTDLTEMTAAPLNGLTSRVVFSTPDLFTNEDEH